MATTKKKKTSDDKQKPSLFSSIDGKTRNWVGGSICIILGLLFILAMVGNAGVAGEKLRNGFGALVGVGYFMIPTLLFVLAYIFFTERKEFEGVNTIRIIAAILIFLSGLSLVSIAYPDEGGIIGNNIAELLIKLFDVAGSTLILGGLFVIGFVIIFRELMESFIAAISAWREERALRKAEASEEEDVYGEYAADDDEEEDEEYVEEKRSSPRQPDNSPIKEVVIGGMTGKKEKISSETPESSFAVLALSGREYVAPPLSLLRKDSGKPGVGDIKANANLIKRTLQNFGINVEMDEITIGPTVTRYSLKPAEGVRLQKILGLQTNLELALAAHPVRIEAPIPGKSLVGIEVPNTSKAMIGLAELFSSAEFRESENPLMFALGRGISGKPYFDNLAKAPHMLVAGATGSGKSVTLHAIICSLLYRNGPQNLKFLMVDPKRVELSLYNGIPHLLDNAITNPKKAVMALKWAVKEMDRRYQILEKEKKQNIASYHEQVVKPAVEKGLEGSEAPDPMPYIVIVIDEMGDLMQVYPKELETEIIRLAQMSRAVGIHLILTTQRPSKQVITGLIKANVPTRLALQVASNMESRIIIDTGGAENLLGAGDMLYQSAAMSKPARIQSAYISEKEIKSIVTYLQKQYEDELPQTIDVEAQGKDKNVLFEGDLSDSESVDENDGMYEEAREIVIKSGKASTSYLQRMLRIGYSRAARIMDILEREGVIGPQDGARPRQVLIQPSENETPDTEE